MNTHQPVLTIQGLQKRYGQATVVDDLNLRVEQGEIFGILGTNGAGKTTSVECAQGLRKPDAGTVRVLGHDPIAERSALRGRVGSQLQDSQLPDRLRVGEAIRLFADTSTQADRALERWKLKPLARAPFGSLSGGQRQRLFLALALLNNPELVFLDELTQGLDPDARRSVWKLIHEVRDAGATIVLVTHFMEEAEALCDRVTVMSQGRALATGTPDELIDTYGVGTRVRFTSTALDVEWCSRIPGVVQATQSGSDVEVVGAPTIVARLGHGLVERGMGDVPLRVAPSSLEDALQTILSAEEVAA